MNVDIIEPLNRILLPGSAKVTALHVDKKTLFLGLGNGDLTIMKMNIELDRHPNVPRSVKSFRSFNDVKKLFVDNDQSHLFLVERTFRNVTMNLTAITTLQTISLFQDGREVLLIGNSEVLRVFEWVGSHLNLLVSFDEARNYSTFGFMESGDHKLILVALKKKIFVYIALQRSRNVVDFVKSREILLKERLKVLYCYPQHRKVLLALNNAFSYLDLDNNYVVKDISSDESDLFNFPQNSSFSYFGLNSPVPFIKILPVDQNTSVIARGTQFGLLDTLDFRSIRDANVNLSNFPANVVHLRPYYLLVVYSKKLEILSMLDGTVIQEFHHQLNSSHIPMYADKEFIIIGSNSHVFQFNILPYQKQLDQFLSLKTKPKKYTGDIKLDIRLQGIEQALAVVANVDEEEEFFKDGSDSQISNKKMKTLFLRDLHKEKAFIYFDDYSLYRESLVDIASEWVLSCKEILSLFPNFLNADSQLGNTANSEASGGNFKNITAEEAEEMRNSDSWNTTELKDPTNGVSDPKSRKSRHNKRIHNFAEAVNNLIIYLTDQRRIHSTFLSSSDKTPAINWKGVSLTATDIYPEINSDKAELVLSHYASVIDTSLFLCYYYTKPMLLGPLLRLPNNKCDAEIVNACLLKNLHSHSRELQDFIKELLDFYFGRGLHEDALKMMKEIAHENNEPHGDSFDEYIKGPDLTISYLQRLGDENLDLIFEYAYWILTENKNLVVQNSQAIFMNDSYACESYDNVKVCDFFRTTLKRDDLAILYLEWLLNESDILEHKSKKTQAVKLSTRLCLLYLKDLKSLKISDEKFFRTATFTKLRLILSSTNDYEPWTVLKNIPTSEDRFLELTIFIYKRLGEHQKSVDILFNQLSDLDGAIEYCAEIYEQPHNKETGQTLLHKLLEDLLMHYDENEDMVVKLLELQGEKMDILRVLTALPNVFPLHKVQLFLQETLNKSDENLVTSRLASQLYNVGSVKVRNLWLQAQSGSVSIKSSKQLCHICSKNLGYNVLSLDSDSQVVHYGCYNKEKDGLQNSLQNSLKNGFHNGQILP